MGSERTLHGVIPLRRRGDGSAHVGEDRRGAPAPPLRRAKWWAAGGCFLAVTLPISSAAQADVGVSALGDLSLLGAGIGLLFFAGAVRLWTVWPTSGSARDLRIGVAWLAAGIAGALETAKFPEGTRDVANVRGVLVLAFALAGAVMALEATRGPEVDSSLRVGSTLRRALLLVAGSAAGVVATALVLPQALHLALLGLLLPAAWATAAGVGLTRGIATQRSDVLSAAVASLALAATATTWMFAGSAAGAGHGLAMGFAVAGVVALGALERELAARSRREQRRARQSEAWVHAAEERDHDLRSALLAVESAARVLERHGAALEPERREEILGSIASEASRLRALLSEEQLAGVDDATSFRLFPVLQPLVTLDVTSGARVDLDCAPDLYVHASPVRTAEVFRNLLDNAREHAPQATVRISAERHPDAVQVRFADDGPGIPDEDRVSIFRRGFRGRRTEPRCGRGLGLFTATQLMAEQGGSLALDEDAPAGTTFVLRFPLPPTADVDASTRAVDIATWRTA